MAAFFGLFGTGEPSKFLDSDDSKTLGDVEYMREGKTVRRTFPKTVNNKEGGERIVRISAVEETDMSSNRAPKPTPTPTPSQSFNFNSVVPTKVAPTSVAPASVEPTNVAPTNVAPTNGASSLEPQAQSSQPNPEPRSSDNSMDIFRDMARNRKRK